MNFLPWEFDQRYDCSRHVCLITSFFFSRAVGFKVIQMIPLYLVAVQLLHSTTLGGHSHTRLTRSAGASRRRRDKRQASENDFALLHLPIQRIVVAG